jgi:hypothetical protein
MQYVGAGPGPWYGEAVRILPGCFRSTKVDLNELAREPGYIAFYFLDVALENGWVTLVGTAEIPKGFKLPTRFRKEVANGWGYTGDWWIINSSGKRIKRKVLSPAERRLPIAESVCQPEMIERMASGWNPVDYYEPVVAPPNRSDSQATVHRAVPKKASRKAAAKQGLAVEHYLYFPTKKASSAVSNKLSKLGFNIEQRRSAADNKWLVLARHRVESGDELEEAEELLTQIAEQSKGEYDGRGVDLTAR